MAPYEALYGRKCRSPIGWFDVGETKMLGPELVQQAVEKVAYKLDLPPELDAIHPVFHVSMLRKFLGDPSCTSPIEDIEVTEDLSYEEIPIAILDCQIRKLQTKEVICLRQIWKVLQRYQPVIAE
uniref:Tf2-1-like SH3-like domain-containing protein n=1 Tax=Nicotiana tabacum TaxID=4097 RepID=A0A1S3XIT6_TOBAC